MFRLLTQTCLQRALKLSEVQLERSLPLLRQPSSGMPEVPVRVKYSHQRELRRPRRGGLLTLQELTALLRRRVRSALVWGDFCQGGAPRVLSIFMSISLFLRHGI